MNDIVKKIILLCRWRNKTLVLSKELNEYTACFRKAKYCADIVKHPVDYKYNTIIGILTEQQINSCFDHLGWQGELVIYSDDVLKNLPKLHTGTVTDIIHVGKKVVWRFEKDHLFHKTLCDGNWL